MKAKNFNRRTFLRTLSLAVTAPLIVPATVFGADGSVAPSERITIGMIGTGNQGIAHTRVLVGIPQAQIVAVCDPVREKRLKAKQLVDNWARDQATSASKGCADYTVGFLSGWGQHEIDIAQWGNGTDYTTPVEAEGRATLPSEGLNDTAATWHVEFVYANGVRLIFTSDDENPHGIRFEGKDGWVFVNREKIEAQPESLLNVSFKGSDVRLYRSENHHLDFLRSIRTRKDPICPVETGHHTYVICNVSDITARLKRKLQWDPLQERFTRDDEANAMLERPMRAPWKL